MCEERYKRRVMRRSFAGGLVVAAALCASTQPARAQTRDEPPPADLTVRFRDRRIDLGTHFEGFPYVRFRADYDAGQLIYFREARGSRELWTLPLAHGALHLDAGTRIGDIDWSRRGFRDERYRVATREYIVLADDANEERYNLFAMGRDTGAMRRLTDKPYLYGFGLDRAQRQLGYIARYGTGQPYHSCLDVIDLAAGTDREVVCDSPEVTFTWSDVVFSPDGDTVVIQALRASDRNHVNLVAIDLRQPSPAIRLLTDPAQRRRNVRVVREFDDANHFVYTSDEDGFTNVYVYDLATRSSTALTHFREDVVDVAPFETAAGKVYGAIVRRPYESELFVVDPRDASILARRVFDATSEFLDYTGDHALLQSASRRTRLQLDEVTVTRADDGAATLVVSPRAGVPADVARRIERCHVERVQIPTFDIDPQTGRTRLLHAYLQTPMDPPRAPAERFALVEAFYGGDNEFDTTAQILCDAGGIVLSPSVRGSSGFGAEFAALNDHDLGGNEVVDLVYAARYLADRFHLSPRRIGLFGGSHGGYEVMRAMTFPPGVNGHDERFDWGFGISWFGFSNIVSFYEHCNIPDWVLLEAGDPLHERERLLDRSPITHASLATGPMLLLHGEHDHRVPVDESRQMADALRAAHRPVRYVEFAGQGHGLKGLANQYRVWSEIFAFLEPVLAPRAPSAPGATPHRRHARRLWVGLGSLALALALFGFATRERRA
jgi:dienelactone hydrolase